MKRSSSSTDRLNPPAQLKALAAPNAAHDGERAEPEAFEAVTQVLAVSVTKEAPNASLYKVRALYEFQGENAGDLSFAKGEIISVIAQIDENWSEGEFVNDTGEMQRGIFPTNYAEKVTNLPRESANGSASGNVNGSASGACLPELSAETLSQMKSVMPAGSISDITAAITGVKLKASTTKVFAKKEAAPQTQAVGACGSCGCNEFSPNAFKPGQCNMCFHKH